MSESDDRRQPDQTELPGQHPAVVRTHVGDKEVTDIAKVISLNERTVEVEFDDPAVALAVSLAPRVEVDVDNGSGIETILAVPGSRADDNPTSRRVELVRRTED